MLIGLLIEANLSGFGGASVPKSGAGGGKRKPRYEDVAAEWEAIVAARTKPSPFAPVPVIRVPIALKKAQAKPVAPLVAEITSLLAYRMGLRPLAKPMANDDEDALAVIFMIFA